ncbi:oligosaccharide flippase family protein [Bifidobacterium miconisargentati]|uniref:oligosaccharide flippase family protein n=1 Tax=Bifidobacterium miconisargentati TaxID=2834437 RepID=UPI001BDD76A5|nr:oligosaccharide flippase family protein [Bifidobacterium miconisargentati]MBW3090924.1 polysaccharide biosynthesis protein [Bifidobacterium miconisargentati]
MSKNSVAVNYLLNTAYQILILIVPLITTPYVSRVLGAEGIGVYSYTYSIISYFLIIAAMGTATYGQRTIAYHQDDPYARSVKFYEILIFRCVTTLSCCAVYMAYLFSDIAKYRGIAWLQLIYLVAVAFDITWFFQGMEDFRRIVFRNTVAKIFNIILLFVFVRQESDVWVYTLILAGMTLIANLSIWPYVPSVVQKVHARDVKPFKELKDILLLFVPTIAIQVNSVLDKTLIGVFAVDAAENGYYEQTEKVVRMALAVVTSLGIVMIPRMSKLFHDNDTVRMKSYIEKSYQFVWLIGIPIMFGLIAVVDVFVPVFYGPGYDRIKVLMPIYALSVLPVALSNVTGCQFLIPIKKQNVYSTAVLISAVVNVGLNFVFTPRYLADGAAVASVAAEVVGCVVMLIYVQVRDMVDVPAVLRLSIGKFVAGIVMLIAVRATALVLSESVLSLMLLIVEGGAVYVAVLLMERDRFFLELLNRVLGKVRGKLRKA